MRLVWKFAIPQVCIVICLGMVGFVVINATFVTIREQYVRDLFEDRFVRTAKDMADHARASVQQAAVFARLPAVTRAYELALIGDIYDEHSPQSQAAREQLRKELAQMLDSYKEATGQALELHFHLPSGLSLARLWRHKNTRIKGEWVDISDDISWYRPTVMDANKTGEAAMGLEPGSGGFAIRGVIPVKAQDGTQLGTVEVLQDFQPILAAATQQGKIAFALYANKELLRFAVELQDPEKYPPKGDFVRVAASHEDFVESLITPELLSKSKNGNIFENYGRISLEARPLADYSGKQVGIMVCSIRTESISSFAHWAQLTLVCMLAGIIILLSAVLLLATRTLITRPLNMIKAKIQDIAEGRADLSEEVPSRQKDEIGELARGFNVLTAKLAGTLDALIEEDERLQAMLDAMPLGAFLLNKDFTLAYCNQAAAKLFALPDKQALANNFFDFSPECQPSGKSSREMERAHYTQLFTEGRYRFDWVHQNLRGELIPCQVTLVLVQYREKDIIAAYILDLRERQTMLEELRTESAKFAAMAHWYESLLDAVPVPVSVQDTETRWVFINAAVEKLIGKKRQELLGVPCNTWGTAICNTDKCAIVCAQRGLAQTNLLHEGLSYQVDVAILKGLHGEPVGFIEVIQDVTKLELLAQERADAEAANQAKSAFLARVSHEIRTPMNAILGITEIQMHDTALSPTLRDAFSKIYAAGNTLLHIINDILCLSKMESGKMELIPAKYEVASLISDAVHVNQVLIGSKPIDFKLHVDKDIPSELYGDELRIRQILNNLLSNAFKYTQEGMVELAVYSEPEIGQHADLVLVFRVSDSGQGMSAEQMRELFDAYSRFNLSVNHAIEGIGLGMHITQHLVHMMNGEILVESTPDKGSTFTVRLPQENAGSGVLGRELAENLQRFNLSPTVHRKKARIAYEPMPYGRVLVVDDLEMNLYVTKGLLLPYMLSVDTAISGYEAIDKIKSGKEYDIVFMDHMMPKMDGMETVRIMRDLGYERPIVALTANAIAGQATVFMENGFEDFLSKPIDTRQLDMVLKRLIRAKQPPEVLEGARTAANVPKGGDSTLPAFADRQLASIFVEDAQKIVKTLESMHANQYRRDDDVQMYVITVHAMKSALASIGATELSALAHRLEEAGGASDIAVMTAETPIFLNSLRALIEKNTPK